MQSCNWSCVLVYVVIEKAHGQPNLLRADPTELVRFCPSYHKNTTQTVKDQIGGLSILLPASGQQQLLTERTQAIKHSV